MVLRVVDGVAETMQRLVRRVLVLAPLGVFALAVPLASGLAGAPPALMVAYVALVSPSPSPRRPCCSLSTGHLLPADVSRCISSRIALRRRASRLRHPLVARSVAGDGAERRRAKLSPHADSHLPLAASSITSVRLWRRWSA